MKEFPHCLHRCTLGLKKNYLKRKLPGPLASNAKDWLCSGKTASAFLKQCGKIISRLQINFLSDVWKCRMNQIGFQGYKLVTTVWDNCKKHPVQYCLTHIHLVCLDGSFKSIESVQLNHSKEPFQKNYSLPYTLGFCNLCLFLQKLIQILSQAVWMSVCAPGQCVCVCVCVSASQECLFVQWVTVALLG